MAKYRAVKDITDDSRNNELVLEKGTEVEAEPTNGTITLGPRQPFKVLHFDDEHPLGEYLERTQTISDSEEKLDKLVDRLRTAGYEEIANQISGMMDFARCPEDFDVMAGVFWPTK